MLEFRNTSEAKRAIDEALQRRRIYRRSGSIKDESLPNEHSTSSR